MHGGATPPAGNVRAGWTAASYPTAGGSSTNQFVLVGFVIFCFHVFGFFSGALDLGLYRLRPSAISYVLAIAFAVLSGRIISALQHRNAAFMMALTFFLAAGVPLSVWCGGSYQVFIQTWVRSVVIFVLAGALINTVSQSRSIMYVVGLAGATGAVIVNFHGEVANGRLVLAGTRYSNSNAIAIMLLVGMPMVWLLAARERAGFVRKAAASGAVILMLVGLLRTGSREGLIGLGVLCLLAFVRSTPAGKMKLVIAVTILVTGTVLFLPRSLRSRFSTIVQDVSAEEVTTEEEMRLLRSAEGSSGTRRLLLIESLKATVQHPLLGIGMGQFGSYMAAQSHEQRVRPIWSGTHNTYTQVSSEAGLPALCFYLLILFGSMHEVKGIYKRAKGMPGAEAQDIATTAAALHASFLVFAVCALFNHMGYEVMMPLMAGMTVAMSRTATGELDRLELSAAEQDAAARSGPPAQYQPPGAQPGRMPSGRAR